MKKAAWWNGFLSVLLIISVSIVLHQIWVHKVGGIIGSALISLVIFSAWFIALEEMNL